MKLTNEQFAEHFNDRLRMLMRSAVAYDEGDYAEATRLAGAIVKLIGDRTRKTGEINKNFISLASRLGIKPTDMMDSSLAEAMEKKQLHGPLCIMGLHVSGTSGLVPILDGFEREQLGRSKQIPFDQWWNASVIRDCRGNEFSRKIIVETMRDQEDAHTDGDIDPGYADIAYNGAIGISQINKNNITFDVNPARVVVRQIAHEVLRTFVPDLPPQYLNTKGLTVQPITLFEIMETREKGETIQILDHKAIEFSIENTSSPEIWHVWQQFIQTNTSKPQIEDSIVRDETRNWLLRIVFLNYAPYPIEINQAIVSMQHA